MKLLKVSFALLFVVGLFFSSVAEAAAPIKVGQITSLTGDHAAYGQAENNSVAMAIEEINAAGGVLGRKIEIIVYDNRSRLEDTVNAARRLIEEDKVCVIIGPHGSGMHISSHAIVDRGRVPQVGTLPTNPLVTVDENGKTRPWNFRICFLDPYQGSVIAYFTTKNLGKTKAAILYDVASEYSEGLREFFLEAFKKYGGTVVADEGYRGGTDVDFRAQLTQIANANPEVLVIPNLGKDMGLIVKQAREIGGLKDTIIVGGDAYGEFMWEIAGDAMEGTYWVSHCAPDDETLASYFENYRKKFNTECSEFMNGVLAYDVAYWVADAITRAGGDDSAKIRDALANTKDLKLLHATITMDEQHNPKDKDAVILIAKGGMGRFYTKVKPD
ncbi:MAG: ABC transporter substrate-binding protein [Synergistaceae bacterium]|nr:ABC transporter substrate-binding protein [Synergistaceae bacterium]